MNNALPLIYYPNKWLWIDDDSLLLNTIKDTFGKENSIQIFQSSKDCLAFLKNYQPYLLKQNFLKSIINDESYGILKHTPVDFDITSLVQLANDPNRYDEITVMVIDYNMPEIDGFSLAKTAQSFPIKKILLTGKAQETEAIDGFNSNLIHCFVQKSEPKMIEKLSYYLKSLSLQYFQEITFPLFSYLETENKLPLTDPVFINFFQDYCLKHKIKEYYLIDKQGSFMCIDSQNIRSCLIIHTDKSIHNWLTLYSNEKCLSNDELTEIKNRRKIPFFGVGKEAWQTGPSEWSKHLHIPEILEGRERYFWATIQI